MPPAKPKNHKYVGLREFLAKLFADHPSSTYSSAEATHEAARSFRGIQKQSVSYHLVRLEKEGLILNVKRGVYTLNSAYESPADKAQRVQKHLQETGGLIVSTNGNGYTPTVVGETIDMRYVDHLQRSLNLLKQRMRSDLPANKVFYPEDAELLDAVSSELFAATLTEPQREVLRRRERLRSEAAKPANEVVTVTNGTTNGKVGSKN